MKEKSATAKYAILIVFSIIILFPLFWMLLTALKTSKEIYTFPLVFFPAKINLKNFYYILFEMEYFSRYALNSIVITLITSAGVLLFGTLGGYSLGRKTFLGRGFLFAFIVLIIAVPWNIYLIPTYIMESKMHIRNSWIALILPYIALRLPWALIILSGAFASIPKAMEEAAIMDGCKDHQVFLNIMVPLVKSGMVTALLITFIFVWKEFLFAVTLNTDSHWQTLPVGILFLKDELQTLAYGKIGAAIILCLVPIIAIFIPLRKFFFSGFKEGGFIKG